MICKRCGETVPDGSSFCPSCGAELGAGAAEEKQPKGRELSVCGEKSPKEPNRLPVYGKEVCEGSAGSAFGVIKSACSSPAAFTATIAFTVSTLLGVITLCFVMTNSVFLLFYPLGSVITILYAFHVLLSILITIGLWRTYVSAADSRSPRVKTNGLSIIRVGLIISSVMTIVNGAVFEIILIVYLFDLLYSGIAGYIICAMTVVAVVVALRYISYLNGAKLAKDMINTALTGYAYRVPDFLSWFLVMLGGESLLILAAGLAVGVFLLIALGLFSTAALIAFGVFLSSYSRQMKRLTQGSSAAQGAGSEGNAQGSAPSAQPQIFAQPEPVPSEPESVGEQR